MTAKYGLVLPRDLNETNYIASWTWKEFNLQPMKMDLAVGIVDTKAENTPLVGSAMFYNFNGCNVELNLYGPGTPTIGLFRCLARIAVLHLNVLRVTIKTAPYNDHIIRAALKFGFEHEGTEKNFYGLGRDAVRMVLHREGIERIAFPFKGKLH